MILTALNMIVLPALYWLFGEREPAAIPQEDVLDTGVRPLPRGAAAALTY